MVRRNPPRGRVEVWRGGFGAAYLFPALSGAGASRAVPCSVSRPRSSNRTCSSPASGSRSKVHAFAMRQAGRVSAEREPPEGAFQPGTPVPARPEPGLLVLGTPPLAEPPLVHPTSVPARTSRSPRTSDHPRLPRCHWLCNRRRRRRDRQSPKARRKPSQGRRPRRSHLQETGEMRYKTTITNGRF